MHLLETAFFLIVLTASVLGQSIQISSPAPGTTVTPGANITVQVGYPVFVGIVDRVSVVVGFQSCSSSLGCPAPADGVGLGSVLEQVSYNPLTDTTGNLYQDINVTVPALAAPGQVNLGVVGFFVSGASYVPGLDYANVTLNYI
ncbi:hypothetical protein BS17DRAFT_740041 [Gyrodon lividus]|nr:hypothetical protein BS17DRAFT_740041 [Gyrodon lividus]